MRAHDVAMFVRLLGRFAGDTALTFKATGGVYVAGGVALALGALFDARLFRAAFEAHPPYETLLASIPTALITYQEPGLLGCANVGGAASWATPSSPWRVPARQSSARSSSGSAPSA